MACLIQDQSSPPDSKPGKVQINEEESESFKPKRVLRHCDPLSSYLFLLWTEGLTDLLAHGKESENISGAEVCRDAPTITNLLFVDDSFILMKANTLGVSETSFGSVLYHLGAFGECW